MSVRTAVIPVAGAGTRVFPITTAVEKCMLPIYVGARSRPIIDFMVEDCVQAGIERVIFVTSDRGRTQLREYFEQLNRNLEAQLHLLGKDELLRAELERRKAYHLTYEYIIQPPDVYGSTYPLALAKEHLRGEEQFVMVGGDDFIYREDGGSELVDALALWQKTGATHVIMGAYVPYDEGPRYGILQVDERDQLRTIEEKPPLEHVPPKPMANISRYLLADAVWPFVDAEMGTDRGGAEHVFVYAVNAARNAGQTFHVHAVSGVYMDGGNFDGLFRASQYITAHPRKY